MTTTQLKSEIDAVKAVVEGLDDGLPGAANINAFIDKFAAAAENPLALAVLAAVLTARGA